MSLPSAAHVSSTFKSGAPRMSLPSVVRQFSILHFFFGAPWMSLPSAVHVSSIIKCGASGDWEIFSSVVCRIGSFAKHVYMCICILYSLLLLLFVFCFVLYNKKKKGRSRDKNRHHGKGRMDEISVLSLLSSYLQWEVSKEGQLSYPNFVRGL